MADIKEMTLAQMQGNLQQILLDDHQLTAAQRYSLKSAIEMFGLVKAMAPGFAEANEQMRAKNGKGTESTKDR